MKRAPLLVLAGTVAGFAGMLLLPHPARGASWARVPPGLSDGNRHPAKRARTRGAPAAGRKAKGSGASAGSIRSAVGATENTATGNWTSRSPRAEATSLMSRSPESRQRSPLPADSPARSSRCSGRGAFRAERADQRRERGHLHQPGIRHVPPGGAGQAAHPGSRKSAGTWLRARRSRPPEPVMGTVVSFAVSG